MSVDGYPAGGAQQGAGEDWAMDSIANGCSCHMDEQLDQSMYMLEGIPSKYVPDTTYNITLLINDTSVISEPEAIRYGGFLAEVSEGLFKLMHFIGLVEKENIFRTMQIVMANETGLSSGLLRVKVAVILYSQFITMSLMELEPAEQWGYITAVSIGTPQIKSEEASIHELGVSLMQYWIALLAIAVVFVMILLAYVVIRGGSSHYRG